MKTLRFAALIAVSALFALSFNSCGKDDIVEEKNKETKEAIVKQYLNQTVYPTYGKLAEETQSLVENLEALKANKTQTNLNQATVSFLEARKWWEASTRTSTHGLSTKMPLTT